MVRVRVRSGLGMVGLGLGVAWFGLGEACTVLQNGSERDCTLENFASIHKSSGGVLFRCARDAFAGWSPNRLRTCIMQQPHKNHLCQHTWPHRFVHNCSSTPEVLKL